MQIPELNNEDIKDDWEMSEVLSEELEAYIESIEKDEGMQISKEEADKLGISYEESWAYLWSDKASKLINAEVDRLTKIGIKWFPNGDICVSSSMYQEE